MKRNLVVHLRRFEGLDDAGVRRLGAELSNPSPEPNGGFAFVNSAIGTGWLESTLALERSTYQTMYMPAEHKFVEVERTYFEKVPFTIDLGTSTLDVYSNSRNTSRLVAVLGRLLEFRVSIGEVQWSPTDILRQLRNSRIEYSLEKLTINNYISQKGLVGRYSALVNSPAAGEELANAYPGDVSFIRLSTTIGGVADVRVSISSSGGFSIRCEEDFHRQVLQELKQLLLGGGVKRDA